MKKLIPLLILSVTLSLLAGCATDGEYETRLRPPDAFNPVFYRYQQLQGQKIMVVAIDPGEHWAFGYDHGRGSIEEATEAATLKCNEARRKYSVFTQAKIFAVNDDVVYYDNQFK